MPSATCRELVKVYWTRSESVRALEGIDAHFPDGRLSVVVGPSGSGKSTLLRLLAALDRPTSGSIAVGETDLSVLSERDQRRVRRESVGYLFQRPSENFVSYMTVEDHLRLMTADQAQSASALRHLGIAERGDHRADELSGGEQQRAALAQVVSGPPRLIVADEPTAELDTATRSSLISLVTALRDEGWTFVIGTHDDELVRVADHLVELDHGRIRQSATSWRPSYAREPERAHEWRPDATTRPTTRPAVVRAATPTRSGPKDLLVQAVAVNKTYTRGDEVIHAVRDVDLELHSSSLIGIMGRSGSGKTTLLNILGCWEIPDSGAIRWAEALGDDAASNWKTLAVVPQRLGLFDEFTVEENVLYPARLDETIDQARDRFAELIRRLGLDGLAARQMWELSIGQQQRVAMARALIVRPTVLLVDEPTGHQDTAHGEAVFDALEEAANLGTCVVVATHNEAFASRFDTLIKMSDGRIQSSSTPSGP